MNIAFNEKNMNEKYIKQKSGKCSGADAVIQMILEEGIDTVFGYPGGAIIPVYDSLYKYQNSIKHILVRHEQCAAHAAEGYAQITGRPGVCIATSGPGATNLVTGIADAMIDSIPLVCITGQVNSSLLGSDAFQEIDIAGITVPITKWNCIVKNASDIPMALKKAFYVASTGRPGPVLVDITKDAQNGSFYWEDIDTNFREYTYGIPNCSNENIRKAVKLINESKRPFLFIGHGVKISKAENEIIELMERADIPTATTLLGLSSIPSKHKNYVGMLGMHGNYAPNILTNEADLIIAVGMRFDDRVTSSLEKYAPNTKIIHIDIDPAEISKNLKVEVALSGDAKEILQKLLLLIKDTHHNLWLEEFKKLNEVEFEKVIKKDFYSESNEILMSEVINVLSDLTNGNAIIVADVGQHQMMTARYYKFKDKNSFFTSGGLGTMGYALPVAIGIASTYPKKKVIAIAGDGSFQMTLQELGTLIQEDFDVKIIVLNNSFLGMVRQWQELFFEKRYSFVDIKSPRFQTLASSYGIPAFRVEKKDELKNTIEKFLSVEGSAFLEVVVVKEQNVMPMIESGASVHQIRLK